MYYLQNGQFRRMEKRNQKQQQEVYELEIDQNWKVLTYEPLEVLPYTLRHLQLSRLCQSFHQIKFLYSQVNQIFGSRNSTNNQSLNIKASAVTETHSIKSHQSQKNQINENMRKRLDYSKTLFKVIWRLTHRTLHHSFQRLKQQADMLKDQQDSSFESNDSYMRFIKWKNYDNLTRQQQQQLGIHKIQVFYTQKRKKFLIEAFLNMMKESNNYQQEEPDENLYELSISVQALEQIDRIIKNKRRRISRSAFEKIKNYDIQLDRKKDQERRVKIKYFVDILDGFNQRKSRSIKQTTFYQINKHSLSIKKIMQQKKENSRFGSGNKKSQFYQQKHETINKFQRNNSSTARNKKWTRNNSKDTARQDKIVSDFNSSSIKKSEENFEQYQKNVFREHINSLPTKRQKSNQNESNQNGNRNLLISRVQNNVNSQTLFKMSQIKEKNYKFQKTIQQVNYQSDLHIPITQRISNNHKQTSQIESECVQEEVILSQAESNEESGEQIIQQIYIIRDFSERPKRKPDDYLTIPVISSKINLVQVPAQKSTEVFQISETYKRQHFVHNNSFYDRKSCENCQYCQRETKTRLMIEQIRKKMQKSKFQQVIIEQKVIFTNNIIQFEQRNIQSKNIKQQQHFNQHNENIFERINVMPNSFSSQNNTDLKIHNFNKIIK